MPKISKILLLVVSVVLVVTVFLGVNSNGVKAALAEEAGLSDDDLFPVCTEALRLIGLVHIEHGDIHLTSLGQRYCQADQAFRKHLFGQQLLQNVPLAAT